MVKAEIINLTELHNTCGISFRYWSETDLIITKPASLFHSLMNFSLPRDSKLILKFRQYTNIRILLEFQFYFSILKERICQEMIILFPLIVGPNLAKKKSKIKTADLLPQKEYHLTSSDYGLCWVISALDLPNTNGG